ncbi:LysR family transcriptional regulator [Deinococcus roseus]|uniref:LysR family transcriptional regulator n=1 Tax=Deinococcus roseus TaxID=392414 RepID=A0ABQ2D180_9DEIO|nr:LysR family transcriptional regulator [Deinococcus roseus]GGJ36553.1 LysR family transcriptional regulator [Deinococcus roseus]
MQLDLNLLRALDVLLEENSVGGAAFRLNLSEPAMSRTLSRIRKVTGDAILVRTGHTMTPTPYAQRIRDEVHLLVQQARLLLAPQKELDPLTLSRTFTLRSNEAILSRIGPDLLARIAKQAPQVRLRFLAESSTDTPELRHGHIDLEMGSSTPNLPEFRHETLGEDHLEVVMRSDHPLAVGDLTPERYAAARHVSVSRRGRLRDPMDDLLETLGLQRQVVTTVPSSMAALQFIQHSEMVVLAPVKMGQALIQQLGLMSRPLPFPIQPTPLVLIWHGRMQGDLAHVWLRENVRETVRAALGDLQTTAG